LALAYPDKTGAATWHAEWAALSALGAIDAEWRALCARALQPNIFYDPDFAGAAAPVFGTDTGAVLVRDDAGTLIGVFPTRRDPRRYGIPFGVITSWTHSYAPLGLPLVDRDQAAAALRGFLEHLACDMRQRFLLMPLLPRNGAFADALAEALTICGLPCAEFNIHARAMLRPTGDRGGYIAHAINRTRRKNIARMRNRLVDRGDLVHETARDDNEVPLFLTDFLALEASGWKGRAATAAACHPDIRQFVTRAMTALGARGGAEFDRLRIGNRTIAATIVLRSGDTAWAWKIAYDEEFSRYSPGVQLMIAVTQRLLSDRGVVTADSCATPDHPMIDNIWRERLALSDRLIALRPGDAAGFRIACGLESLRRGAIGAVRSLRAKTQRG
jgi:CelD/BcsL family acetyltransferase involved in cellulose biosynthesis